MYNFIHIPKVAGVSMHHVIGEEGGRISYAGHTRAINMKTLSFVRNPYDRLVSAYFYLLNGGRGYEIDLAYQTIVQQYKDFKDFCMRISEDDLTNKIYHIKPMSYFLCDDNNNLVVTKWFKIEEIEKIDEFLVGLKYKKLSEFMENTSTHLHYSLYMDGDIITEINKIYDLDFKLFNYDKL